MDFEPFDLTEFSSEDDFIVPNTIERVRLGAAKMLAYLVHDGQKYYMPLNKEIPYIVHVETVVKKVKSLPRPLIEHDLLSVAWLHDTVEDTSITLGQLKPIFGTRISSAVEAITKNKDESYTEYVARCCKNRLSVHVKYADLAVNLENTMLLAKFPHQEQRVQDFKSKYIPAIEYIRKNFNLNYRHIVPGYDIE